MAITHAFVSPKAAGPDPTKFGGPEWNANHVLGSGMVVWSSYSEYTANADLTTAIPKDDTIPQNTEGTQIFSVTRTPESITNKLRIRFQCWGGTSTVAVDLIAALFINSGANAVKVANNTTAGANFFSQTSLEHEYTPGALTSQTIAIRVGSGVTIRLNGLTSGRVFGGAGAATLVVEEITG